MSGPDNALSNFEVSLGTPALGANIPDRTRISSGDLLALDVFSIPPSYESVGDLDQPLGRMSPETQFLHAISSGKILGCGSSAFVLAVPKEEFAWKVIPQKITGLPSPIVSSFSLDDFTGGGIEDLIKERIYLESIECISNEQERLKSLEASKLIEERNIWKKRFPDLVDFISVNPDSAAHAGLLNHFYTWLYYRYVRTPGVLSSFGCSVKAQEGLASGGTKLSFSRTAAIYFKVLRLPNKGDKNFREIYRSWVLEENKRTDERILSFAPLVKSFLQDLVIWHEAGVIHGDIRPHNIVRGVGENEKSASCVDFGSARYQGTSVAKKFWLTPTPEFARIGLREEGVYEQAFMGFDGDYYGAAWVIAYLIAGQSLTLFATPPREGVDKYLNREIKTKEKISGLWVDLCLIDDEYQSVREAGKFLIHAFCALLCWVRSPKDLKEFLNQDPREFSHIPLYLKARDFTYEGAALANEEFKQQCRGVPVIKFHDRDHDLPGEIKGDPGVCAPAGVALELAPSAPDLIIESLLNKVRADLRAESPCCVYSCFSKPVIDLADPLERIQRNISAFEKARCFMERRPEVEAVSEFQSQAKSVAKSADGKADTALVMGEVYMKHLSHVSPLHVESSRGNGSLNRGVKEPLLGGAAGKGQMKDRTEVGEKQKKSYLTFN